MPRISADTVAEHVAQQEAAVFEAAIRLFTERGYDAVSLADVAAEVGLKRTSLYRYFPDKAHILLRWFQAELPEQVAASEALLTSGDPPLERIDRWALAQLAYARRPEHALIAALGEVAPQLGDAARAELADSHRGLMAPLAGALGDLGVDPADVPVVVDLLGGLVLAAARHEAATGDVDRTRTRLLAAIHGLVGS